MHLSKIAPTNIVASNELCDSLSRGGNRTTLLVRHIDYATIEGCTNRNMVNNNK